MSISEIFMSYLYFYGFSFNHKTYYIQVNEESQESFYLKNLMSHHCTKELTILDSEKSKIILTKVFKRSDYLK